MSVEFEPLPAITDARAAMAADSPRVHDASPNVICHLKVSEFFMRKLFVTFCMVSQQLAWASDFGDGFDAYTNKDYATAYQNFQKSARLGDANAMWFLCIMHKLGRGVQKDYFEAIRWCRLAIKGKNRFAINTLADFYAQGIGVPQNYTIAHMWYIISAISGESSFIQRRDKLEMRMTPQQIAEAQRMARECVDSNYERCE